MGYFEHKLHIQALGTSETYFTSCYKGIIGLLFVLIGAIHYYNLEKAAEDSSREVFFVFGWTLTASRQESEGYLFCFDTVFQIIGEAAQSRWVSVQLKRVGELDVKFAVFRRKFNLGKIQITWINHSTVRLYCRHLLWCVIFPIKTQTKHTLNIAGGIFIIAEDMWLGRLWLHSSSHGHHINTVAVVCWLKQHAGYI